MLKTIGIFIIATVVVFYGFSTSTRYSKRIKILESMVLFVEFTENQIRYLGNTVDNIIGNITINGNYKELYFLKDIRNTNNFTKQKNILPLSQTDLEHIIHFISELGFADIDGEIARCELYKDIFENDLNDAKLDFNNKGKLYKSMSLLTAAAIFIIFI